MAKTLQQVKTDLRERCPAPGTFWRHKPGYGVYTVVAPAIIVADSGAFGPAVSYAALATNPPNHWVMPLDMFLQQFTDVSGEAVAPNAPGVAEVLAQAGAVRPRYLLRCDACRQYAVPDDADMWCACDGRWTQVPIAHPVDTPQL